MACLLLISFYFLSRQAAAVSVWMNSEEVEKKENVIVLDPGHGGSDPGMIGIDGLEEKNINLSVTLLLKEKLEEKGYTVVLTREEDKGLYDESAQNKKAQDLQRRIALIDETAPALTVSIHQNSYHDPAVKGPQVFYYETSPEGKDWIRNNAEDKKYRGCIYVRNYLLSAGSTDRKRSSRDVLCIGRRKEQ